MTWVNLWNIFSTEDRHPLADDAMLKYFLSVLEVRSRLIEPTIGNDPLKHQTLCDIKGALINFYNDFDTASIGLNDAAWSEAYRLERLLVLVEHPDALVGEIERRLRSAEDEKIGSASRLRALFETIKPQTLDTSGATPVLRDGAESTLRHMLLSILEATHWAYQRKFHARPIHKKVVIKMLLVGLAAFVAMLLPYIFLYADAWSGDDELSLSYWAWLPLWTALSAGFFGAIFSRLLYLQSKQDAYSLGELKQVNLRVIFLRGSIGMCGAAIVYFFLQSGIVDGSLIPKFSNIDVTVKPPLREAQGEVLRLVLPNKDLALLTIWSFLAGFSERLVPSILQSAESKLEGSGTARKSG